MIALTFRECKKKKLKFDKQMWFGDILDQLDKYQDSTGKRKLNDEEKTDKSDDDNKLCLNEWYQNQKFPFKNFVHQKHQKLTKYAL